MFSIKIRSARVGGEELARTLWKAFQESRFIMAAPGVRGSTWTHGSINYNGFIYIIQFSGIRLKQAKWYCGNHPGPCPVRITPTKKARRALLEGMDWLTVNDKLNEILDAVHADADVRSKFVVIRRGTMRRVRYDQNMPPAGALPVGQWQEVGDLDEDYRDRRGKKSKRSWCPNSTPGSYGWLLEHQEDHDHHEHV